MANRAIHRESRRLVIRIGRSVVILRVARSAIRRCACVLAPYVALNALQSRMHSRESKSRVGGVVELRATPSRSRVAHGAVLRKPSLNMVRIGRAVIVTRVAAVASLRRSSRVTARVTGSARHARVGAGQRESHFAVVER